MVCVPACCPLMPCCRGYREAVEKLRTVDDAFRQQLDLKEENHRREMEEMTRRKQQEVDAANKHVSHFTCVTSDSSGV